MKISLRQLKCLIKEAIGDNENLVADFDGAIDLLNKFKSSRFQDFIVASGDHYVELENNDKQFSITLRDKITLEFMFYDYEFTEDPIWVFEVKFVDPEYVWHINLTTTLHNKKIRPGIDLPNGPTQHYEIVGHVGYLLTHGRKI